MYYSETKHKVFISYYHNEDQNYKDYIDRYLSNNIINKSVKAGEYNPDNKDEYIKRLIREEKISDSSVIVVLIGKDTRKRKHVDWEIYAGLSSKIRGNSGLIGVLLPEIHIPGNQYFLSTLPARLADNVSSGYAKIYSWSDFINSFDTIIDQAYIDRVGLRDRIDNHREQMHRNLGWSE